MFPITVYHGSDTNIQQLDQRPLYVTPNPMYAYIQHSKYAFQAQFSPQRPYWTDNQNMIESIRHRPDDLQLLRDMGYDALIYAKPGEPGQGASGWGNDSAQYICLSPATLSGWSPVLGDRTLLPPPSRDRRTAIGPLYHGTDTVFHHYQNQGDIGIHFGSEAAAKARILLSGRQQFIEIERIEPSPIDLLRVQYIQQKEHTGTLSLTMNLLLRKIEHPKANLYDILAEMSEDELLHVAMDYKEKPDIPTLQQSIARGSAPVTYQVKSQGRALLSTPSAEYAARFADFAQAHLLKKSMLLIDNPLTLPDLGTWSLTDVLRHIPNSQSFQQQMNDTHDQDAQLAIVHTALRQGGFDGIRYKNAVEDAGHWSYIALESSQVITLPPPIPRTPDPRSIDLSLRKRMA